MSIIKLCPFCGEFPESFTESHDGVPKRIRGWSQIRCVNKNCLVAVYIHRPLPLDKVIEIWNSRK